jgi:hypothetical protein
MYHYTTIRTAKIKNTGLTKHWQEYGAPETFICNSGDIKWGNLLGKQCQLLKNLNIYLYMI